jgi:NADH-quinone oxidoreductase subunit F
MTSQFKPAPRREESKGQIRLYSKWWDLPESWRLQAYESKGGYEALKFAFANLDKTGLQDEVKKSNLRGRGGAGFPTGVKWGFLPKNVSGPVYLAINADESEPGTFKDRYIMELSPHNLIEGCILTCWVIGAKTCYIYVRGEYTKSMERLNGALKEAYAAGYLGKNILGSGLDLDIYVHSGAGAYICGEETAMLDSLEGKKGQPRLKPPFPAIKGLFEAPTIVNNVESIASIPFIALHGGEWFSHLGCEKNGGTKLYSISGHVKYPGVYELYHDVMLNDIIYTHCGGLSRPGAKLKAVIPGGTSMPVLRADEINIRMDNDSLRTIGSGLGTGGSIVMDDSTCMVRALLNISKFYAHESCGQCTPCRDGTGWLAKIGKKIEKGHGTLDDIATLKHVADRIEGNTICALGEAAAWPVQSFVNKFYDEFVEHVTLGRCPHDKEPVRVAWKSRYDVIRTHASV